MSVIKAIKKSTLITSTILIVAGLIMAFFPIGSAWALGYSFAAIILIIGIGFICRYFMKDKKVLFEGYEFVIGVCLVVGSIYTFINVEDVIEFVPMLFGVAVFVSGLGKLQHGLSLLKVREPGAKFVLVLAAINIAFSVVCVINPFGIKVFLIIAIGLGLLYSGMTDLVSGYYLARYHLNQKQDREAINVEAREI